MTPEVLIPLIVDEAQRMLTHAQHQNFLRCLGIGIGAVGPVDRLSGIISGALLFSCKRMEECGDL